MKAKDKPGAELATAVEKPSETAAKEAAAKNADSGFTVSRGLMDTSPAMSGKDVKALQKRLSKPAMAAARTARMASSDIIRCWPSGPCRVTEG